jgi:hypothetical protein
VLEIRNIKLNKKYGLPKAVLCLYLVFVQGRKKFSCCVLKGYSMAIRLSLRSKRMWCVRGLEPKKREKRKKRGKDFISTVDYCCPYSRDCVFSEIAVLRRSKFI